MLNFLAFAQNSLLTCSHYYQCMKVSVLRPSQTCLVCPQTLHVQSQNTIDCQHSLERTLLKSELSERVLTLILFMENSNLFLTDY